ncbi:MAG TPA: DUF3638 domain-containing protein, partial [Chlamydiales bacterium]|nr:DUF3638 domain-containing protein [Chlamydiales bacterium]
QIPYYRSFGEKQLQFVNVEGKFYWEENPAFSVSLKQPPMPYFPNSLLLENESGTEKKLLVPMREIQKTNAISPKIELYIETLNTTILEYDLKNDVLTPKQIEGTLFYAYILLAQKKHREAMKLLESIPQAMPLSKASLDILTWMVKWPRNSPATATVQLCAVRHLEMRGASSGDAFGGEAIQQINQGKNNIAFDLRMPMPSFETSLDIFQKQVGLVPNLLDNPYLPNLFPGLDEDDLKKIVNIPLNVQKDAGPYLSEHFARLYQLAQSVRTEEEKIQVRTIFRYTRGDLWTEPFSTAMIHFALLYPEIAPKLPPNCLTREWILEAKRLYNETYEKQKTKELTLSDKFDTPVSKAKPTPMLEGSFPNTLPAERISSQVSTIDLTLDGPSELNMHPLALSSLVDSAFSPVPTSQSIPYEIENSSENNYTDAILAEMAEFQNDYAVGSKRAVQKVTWALQNNKLQSLNSALEGKIVKGTQSLQATQSVINSLIHKKGPNAALQLRDELLQQGEALTPVKMQELITMFCREDRKGLLSANPYLTQQEIEQLHNKIFEYLLLETEVAQAKRAKNLVEQLLDPKTENRAVLENAVAQTLQAKIAYSPERDKTMLVFEHRAGMRLRPNQVALIHKMLEMDHTTKQYRNIVAQLMMGGGKTTVIASILLELAARPGRIPLYIAPSAQFETLRSNLGLAQLKYFQRQVMPIDLTRDQMDVKRLGELNKKLHQATKDGSVLLIRAETLQMLQLEFLSLLRMQKTT